MRAIRLSSVTVVNVLDMSASYAEHKTAPPTVSGIPGRHPVPHDDRLKLLASEVTRQDAAVGFNELVRTVVDARVMGMHLVLRRPLFGA